MRNIINKVNSWWNDHIYGIATWATVFSCWAVVMIILLFMAFTSTVSVMHDMEVQLASHGVEWALYTPIP